MSYKKIFYNENYDFRPTVYLHRNGVSELFQGDTVIWQGDKYIVGEPAFEFILDSHTRFDYPMQITRTVLFEKVLTYNIKSDNR